MIKIFVYAADQQLAEQTVRSLKDAGAEHAELLENLNISARQPKDNRYLFVCETPAEKLADLMPKVLQESEYVSELGTWYETQTQILGAYTAHKKRAVLLSAGQLAGNPTALVQHINAQWQCQLTAPEAAQPSEVPSKADHLLGYLVQNLIEKTPPLQHLAMSQAQATGEESGIYSESDAIDAFRKLKASKTDIKTQIANANQQLAKFESLQEESELLLLQLHQVQEELERIYLEGQSYKEAAEHEKAELIAARDHHAHVAHEREQIIGQLNHEKAELIAARDHHAHVAHEREQIIGQLNHEKAELTAAREAEANRANNLQEESELLLLQLHQVQEELENYFLKNQESDAKLAKNHERWQRLVEKHPDYVDAESIRVEVVDPKTQTLKWVLHGLESQGISKSYLEFETFVESGVLGIRFNKTNSRNEPNLKIWPSSCTTETLECIPAGKGNIMRQRALILRDLSASDWKLINTLPQLIKAHLCSVDLGTQLSATISESAAKFIAGINTLPKPFRYDEVVLKANKVNPDYEHLWFELHNASFETYFWPKFEFRLGAANIKTGGFSNHPKLEFPLIDKNTKPFSSWFEESWDENGAKYELRYDLNSNIIDLETLLKLNYKDQYTIRALARSLPRIGEELTKQNIGIKRDVSEWKKLASDMSKLTGLKN